MTLHYSTGHDLKNTGNENTQTTTWQYDNKPIIEDYTCPHNKYI